MNKKIISLLIFISISLSIFAKGYKEDVNKNPIFSPSIALIKRVQENSIYDIDFDKLDKNLIDAVLKSTDDEYSYFIPKEDASSFESNTDGSYVGVGIIMSKSFKNENTGYIKIVGTYVGPARKSGLKTNDYIIQVDDQDIKDLSTKEVSEKIKGKKDTKVKLTIKRGNKEFDVILTRSVIKIPSVVYSMIKDTNIAYININTFARNTASEFMDVLSKLNNVSGVILDLRSNLGGDVNSTIQICDLLLEKEKVILRTEYNEKRKNKNTIYLSHFDPLLDPSIPIVILVNNESASASEILTGCLTDNNRAITIGQTTYGKGVMQEIVPFNSGYVAITCARYKTPNNTDINKIGIKPTIKTKALKLEGKDLDQISLISKDQVCENYVEKHPEFTDENILNFAKENSKYELPDLALYTLIRNQYLLKYDYDSKYLANPLFDPTLKKAIEVLSK